MCKRANGPTSNHNSYMYTIYLIMFILINLLSLIVREIFGNNYTNDFSNIV